MKTLEKVIKNKTFLTSRLHISHNTHSFDILVEIKDICDIVNIENPQKLYEILKPFLYYIYGHNIKTFSGNCIFIDWIHFTYYESFDIYICNEFDHSLHFYDIRGMKEKFHEIF